MSKPQFSQGKFSRFISGKGFYAVLAVCLVGAAGAAWAAADRTVGNITQDNNNLISQQGGASTWTFPEITPTENPQDLIPKASTESLPSPELSSSDLPSGEFTPPSEEPTNLPVVQTLAYGLPVMGEVIETYSGGELVKNTTLKVWRTHDGIDMRAAKGAEVQAVGDGVVSSVYKDPLWGTVVEIEHSDGVVSVYCGLAPEVSVKAGEKVTLKQPIGLLDIIPAEQEMDSHLHFAMKQDGKYIDPLTIINRGPVIDE